MSFYNFIKGIANIVFKTIYRINVYGEENIKKEGSLILCANHIHNFDPIVLSIAFPRQVNWMAKKQIFKSKILAYFLNKLGAFPVDREEVDLSTFKRALKVLKNERVLGIFPEGTRVKTIDIENAKPGIGLIALKSKTSVLPVFIEGNYKPFTRINIYYGQPMDFSDYYSKKVSKEDYLLISKDILQSIYSIRAKGMKK